MKTIEQLNREAKQAMETLRASQKLTTILLVTAIFTATLITIAFLL